MSGLELAQFNPISMFSTSSNNSQAGSPSPLSHLQGGSGAFNPSTAQLARLGYVDFLHSPLRLCKLTAFPYQRSLEKKAKKPFSEGILRC